MPAMELAALSSADYEYLDGGDEGRLERFGPYVFHRPSPAALWRRERPELWERADGVYTRTSSGSGHWTFRRALPATWCVRVEGLAFHVKPTGFGHLGLFPEHTSHWAWVAEQVRATTGGPCRVLHLFAYTGAMTLLAARAGAEVCHVDAVPDINDWARRNAETSGLAQAPVRWITDDALKFVAREGRRGRRYDGLILDPPSYGKGPRGEKWILEEHLPALLEKLLPLMSERPRFVLFTCHTLGFSPVLMRNLLVPWRERLGGRIEAGTMTIGTPGSQRVLPSGFFARWECGRE
jgi:23S rRNA (cytosine1962-C5)-methyltransferase